MNFPRFFLAPMAEISTPALRREIRRLSPETVLFTEMISAAALVHGGMRNDYFTRSYEFDAPLSIQIIGNEPSQMERAAELLERSSPFSIDINMGCSAPEILQRGWGSALMRDQDNAIEIVGRCRKKVKRLSVKMRSGFREADPEKLYSFARKLENEGVDFITIHPRTSDIAFKRSADWSLVKVLHDALTIPVVGNGDIDSAETAAKRLASGLSTAVMIGRAAAKKPWIFTQAAALVDGNEKTVNINIETSALNILNYLSESTPSEILKNRIIRFCTLFAGNLTFGHQLASDIKKTPTVEYAAMMISAYFERNPHERIH